MQLLVRLFVMTSLVTCASSNPVNARTMKIWCFRAGQAAVRFRCEHGQGEGPCGPVCLKGPGEICGGEENIYGMCSEGLICSNCNRCTGCSYYSLTCFDNDCLPGDTS